jgi:hypothetical protein
MYTKSKGRHNQADAEWIVIRGPVRSHKGYVLRAANPGRPISRPGVDHPQGVFGVFNYY